MEDLAQATWTDATHASRFEFFKLFLTYENNGIIW